MASCMSCGKTLSTGKIICSECAAEHMELTCFINRLAEDLVLDENIPTCRLCAIGNCDHQMSSLTCRNAVEAWLLSKANACARARKERSHV